MSEKVATTVAWVRASELHRVLSNAALFMEDNHGLFPEISLVQFNFDAHRMICVATDRFTLGVAKLDLDGVKGQANNDDGATFNIAAPNVKTLVKAAKTTKRDSATRRVTIKQCYDGTVTFEFSSGEHFTMKTPSQSLPKWRQLIPSDSTPMVKRSSVGLNPNLLARFARVNGGSHQMAMYSFDEDDDRKNKPLAVLIDDDFLGLIMPIRLSDNETQWRVVRPEWL